MNKLNKITLAALMLSILVFSLACSMQDLSNLQAGINGSYTLSPSPAPVSAAAEQTDARSEHKENISSQDEQTGEPYTVCTGDEKGKLRVRSDAGTGYPVLTLIEEGQAVKVLEQQELEDGSIWAKLQSPAGWVNARYLCPEK